jgi:hypothetical protein
MISSLIRTDTAGTSTAHGLKLISARQRAMLAPLFASGVACALANSI